MTSNRTQSHELDCRFCRIAAGGARLSHDRVLMESDDYFAIASIGGFVEGWTLVCAKRHTLNLSEDYRQRAFEEFASDVANVVSSAYGQVIVFEHGVRRHGSLTGCGTDHAHLHLVPFRGSFVQCVMEGDRDRTWIHGPARDIDNWTQSSEYLLMADSVGALATSTYFSLVKRPESQFFRKVLAASVGMEEQSDYRLFPFTDRTEQTAQRVGELASERLTAAAA